MDILVGLLAVVSNLTACFILLRTESWLARKGKIPARGIILYLEDVNVFRWGDRVALTVMDFSVAFFLSEGWPLPIWVVVVCLVAGVAWAALWRQIYLGQIHKPDSGHPYAGVLSVLGRLHFAYFASQHTLGFMGIAMVILMVIGERLWSPFVFVGLAAAVGYSVTLMQDSIAGRDRV